MRRRQFLRLGSVGVLGYGAGCSTIGQGGNSAEWSPNIHSTEPSLSIAEQKTITIEASGTEGIGVYGSKPIFIIFRFRRHCLVERIPAS
jgi:hypothetical protein